MKLIFKTLIFLIAILLLSGCTRSLPPTLPANYYYEGSYIDIHSPNEEGWSLIGKSTQGIVFGKKGKEKSDSEIAQVLFFPLPQDTKSENEFLSLIEEEFHKNTNKDRFNIIESDFQLFNQRKYPCVQLKALLNDKKAKISNFSTESLKMKIKSLYCKDAKTKKRGFMIGYSYRGKTIDPNFNEKADSFISGVEFPEYK